MRTVALHPLLAAFLSSAESFSQPTAGDWDGVLEQASEHGLMAELRRLPELPGAARGRIRQECLEVGARNLALAAELRTILRAFRDRDLSCAPLRGVALSERLYGGAGLRPMGDIDLLVSRRDFARVRALFEDLGYREMDRRQGFSETFSNTLKFFAQRSLMVVVEPHWTIAYPPFLDSVDMDAVWGRCVPTQVVGEETLSLGREDLLIHLALHLAHRADAPLLWLLELDRFLRQESDTFEWDLIVSICAQAGVGRLVGQILLRVVSELSTPLPDEVIDLLLTDAPERPPVASRLVERFAVGEREGVAQLLALRGLREKTRYARMLLFPDPDFMMLQYGLRHRWQLAVAYVRRFFRFCWEGTKGLAHLLSG